MLQKAQQWCNGGCNAGGPAFASAGCGTVAAWRDDRRCGEMADAQDLKMQKWRFRVVSLRHLSSDSTLDFIAQNSLLTSAAATRDARGKSGTKSGTGIPAPLAALQKIQQPLVWSPAILTCRCALRVRTARLVCGWPDGAEWMARLVFGAIRRQRNLMRSR